MKNSMKSMIGCLVVAGTMSASIAYGEGKARLVPEEAQKAFPGDQFDARSLPGDQFDPKALPGDQFKPKAFPGDQLKTKSFPGDNFEAKSFPGDNFKKQATTQPPRASLRK